MTDPNGQRSGAIVGGAILILIGGYFLVRQALPAVDLGFWWPLVSVVVGVILVVLAVRPRGPAGTPRT